MNKDKAELQKLIVRITEKKELVIYDLDNTIVNLDVDWLRARIEAKKFVEEKHGIVFPEHIRLDTIEAEVLKRFGEEALKKLFSVREKYESGNLEGSVANGNVVCLAKELGAKNLKQAICTNNLHATASQMLELIGLDGSFEFIVGVDDSIEPKPSTKSCQMILDRFKTNLDKVLFVGDYDDTDGEVARKLGIDYLDVSEIL